jgi:hypothetical protein
MLPPSLVTCDDLFFGSRLSRRQRLLPPRGEEKEKREAVELQGHRSDRRVAQPVGAVPGGL